MAFFIIVLVFAASLFFQQFNWLALGGVNPNLMLIFFQLAAVTRFFSWPFKIRLALVFAAVAILINDFWLWPILALLAVFAASLILRNFLTGNIFADFAILLIFGDAVFYLLINFNQWTFLPLADIILELAYSLLLGLWLLLIFNGKKKD